MVDVSRVLSVDKGRNTCDLKKTLSQTTKTVIHIKTINTERTKALDNPDTFSTDIPDQDNRVRKGFRT